MPSRLEMSDAILQKELKCTPCPFPWLLLGGWRELIVISPSRELIATSSTWILTAWESVCICIFTAWRSVLD